MNTENQLHQQVNDLQLAMSVVLDVFSERAEQASQESETARLITFKNVLSTLSNDLAFYHPLILSGLSQDYDDFIDILVYNQRRLESMAGLLHPFDAGLANLLMDLAEGYAHCVPLVLIALVSEQAEQPLAPA